MGSVHPSHLLSSLGHIHTHVILETRVPSPALNETGNVIQQFAQGPALCPEPDAREPEMNPVPEVFTVRLGQKGYPLHDVIRSARELEPYKL